MLQKNTESAKPSVLYNFISFPMGDDQYPPRFAVCKRNRSGFQRDNIPLVRSRAESPCRVWDRVPQTAAGHSAKGELKNSPVDCYLRGNALQERAFPYIFPLSFIINCQKQYI